MDHIKTFKEVENTIELIEYFIAEQDRYRYSNDILINTMFDKVFYSELESQLKYFNRVSNKYLNKLIRGRV